VLPSSEADDVTTFPVVTVARTRREGPARGRLLLGRSRRAPRERAPERLEVVSRPRAPPATRGDKARAAAGELAEAGPVQLHRRERVVECARRSRPRRSAGRGRTRAPRARRFVSNAWKVLLVPRAFPQRDVHGRLVALARPARARVERPLVQRE
jgi:hypothetical protein